MTGFDYGNARLRAMKSRFLSRKELELLVESGSMKGLIAALTNTAYRRPVEVALTRTSGMACVAEALRVDLMSTLGEIGNFYTDEARESVAVALRRYDLHNLKAILRGLSKSASPAEILGSLLPVGALKHSILVELAQAPDARAAIDSLVSMNSPFAWPLLKLRAEHPGADIARLELVLEQWHYLESQAFLEKSSLSGGVLSTALKIEADLVNLLTVLRFYHRPDGRKSLKEWLGSDALDQIVVGPGSLPIKLLVEAGQQETLEAVVAKLEGTPFEAPLRSGLLNYASSGRLSDLEKQLRRFRLQWLAGQIVKDPLGIGVVLGYLALKENEVGNIRWIAQGISLGLETRAILAELELV